MGMGAGSWYGDSDEAVAKNEVHATVLREGSHTPAGSLRGLWGGRGSENAEVGVAASVRIDRRIRHDQRRSGRDQRARVGEELGIDRDAAGELFEIRCAAADAGDRQPVAPSARILRRQGGECMRAGDVLEPASSRATDLDAVEFAVDVSVGRSMVDRTLPF